MNKLVKMHVTDIFGDKCISILRNENRNPDNDYLFDPEYQKNFYQNYKKDINNLCLKFIQTIEK